ncbi:MAG: hypothetical protein IJY20_06955 [Clostridia bacterium]|nr:hypothetical protein [Clostridia bacterium]
MKFVWRQSEFAFFGALTTVGALFILYLFLEEKNETRIALLLLFAVLLLSCQGSPNEVSQPKPNDVVENNEKPDDIGQEHVSSAEISFVLDRDIYIFKNDFPELYTASIRDINNTISYVQNWKFSDVLNTTNFTNIQWSVSQSTNNAKLVLFQGKCTTVQYNADVMLEFYIQNGAKVPLVWGAKIVTDKETSRVSAQDFLDQGMYWDEAVVMADTTLSCLMLLMSEDAMQSAALYYETLADEFMQNKDYDNAIVYYEKANVVGEKLFAAYYAKAEEFLALDDLNNACTYFSRAGNYKDSFVRLLEVYYKLGQKNEKDNDYIAAIYNYSMAGDYSDARAKYKHCNYKQGELYMNNKQYLDAVICFESAANYVGAAEKYQEACYLYADQQLLIGSTETAAIYFSKIQDYKDAAVRIVRYHYEKGTDYFSSKEYIIAAEHFVLAETYSDACTMVSECYYCYGKQQFELNYISVAIEYLSKCRGYKDTDDILLGYYYGEAQKAYALLLTAYSGKGNSSVRDAYEDAIDILVLCEGYEDSTTLIKIVEKTYYVWQEMQFQSNYAATLYNMIVSCSGSIISIEKSGFLGGYDNLSLTYNLSNNTFSAELTNVLGRTFRDERVICALITLFTDIKDVTDLKNQLSKQNSWIASNEGESFSIKYGGYNIVIQTMKAGYGHVDCIIKVEK